MNRKQRRALKAQGVKVPSIRKEEEIRSEYLQLCAQAGEIQFKVGQMQEALDSVNSRLSSLNQEYVDLKASIPAVTPKEEAPSAEAPVQEAP